MCSVLCSMIMMKFKILGSLYYFSSYNDYQCHSWYREEHRLLACAKIRASRPFTLHVPTWPECINILCIHFIAVTTLPNRPSALGEYSKKNPSFHCYWSQLYLKCWCQRKQLFACYYLQTNMLADGSTMCY